VESPWESPPGHSWNCIVTTTFLESPSQSYRSHSSTPAVPITFSESSSGLHHSHSYIHGVTFGVALQSQLDLHSHYNLFGVTFAVASRSQRHSCSPYNIFGVTFGVHAVNPVSTVVSYRVESASQGLSLPTTYLPPSLSTQHPFTTDIYSTSLHTQADSWLFSGLLRSQVGLPGSKFTYYLPSSILIHTTPL
jgi:hypothetical protein